MGYLHSELSFSDGVRKGRLASEAQIKGLTAEVLMYQERNAVLRREVERLKSENAGLKSRIECKVGNSLSPGFNNDESYGDRW